MTLVYGIEANSCLTKHFRCAVKAMRCHLLHSRFENFIMPLHKPQNFCCPRQYFFNKICLETNRSQEGRFPLFCRSHILCFSGVCAILLFYSDICAYFEKVHTRYVRAAYLSSLRYKGLPLCMSWSFVYKTLHRTINTIVIIITSYIIISKIDKQSTKERFSCTTKQLQSNKGIWKNTTI